MTDKKLTDSEIVKALEGAILNAKSVDCKVWSIEVCKLENALDLITRLQAEDARLICQVKHLKKYDEERDIRLHAKLIATAKAEAYKEFAERVKEKAYTYSDITGYQSTVVDVSDIDETYEELVGGDGA